VLAGIPIWALSTQVDDFAFDTNPQSREFALQTFQQNASLTILVGALLVMSRTIAFDRERQFVRFLFAQPVRPWAFYLQRFLIGLVVFAACYILVPVGWSQFVVPVPVMGTIWATLTTGLLVGSLAMLCAAITQRDGIPLIVVVLGAGILGQIVQSDLAPTWAEWLWHLLPPITKAGRLREAWLGGTAPPLEYLPLILGYSAGMLASALVIVKRAPLVR
jgi:ABC-type transport system involved in multi-copper enzyme maturation permease subunit